MDLDLGYERPTAWTARALAQEIRVTTLAVNRVLRSLKEEGRVDSRRMRGRTFWKLDDLTHDRWSGLHLEFGTASEAI